MKGWICPGKFVVGGEVKKRKKKMDAAEVGEEAAARRGKEAEKEAVLDWSVRFFDTNRGKWSEPKEPDERGGENRRKSRGQRNSKEQ